MQLFKALPVTDQELLIDPKGLEKQLPKQLKPAGDTHSNLIDLTDATTPLQTFQKLRVEEPSEVGDFVLWIYTEPNLSISRLKNLKRAPGRVPIPTNF